MRTIGLIGGTGPQANGLAAAARRCWVRRRPRLTGPVSGSEVIQGLRATWPQRTLDLRAVSNDEAADTDLVVTAGPRQGMLEASSDDLGSAPGQDRRKHGQRSDPCRGDFLPLTMPTGSVTAELQALLPNIAGGVFHHRALASDLDHGLGVDVLVFGDSLVARREVVAT